MDRKDEFPLDKVARKLKSKSDKELDDYVARLIAEEAARKARTYDSQGATSLINKAAASAKSKDLSGRKTERPRPYNTNKRFLSNILKQADAHNKKKER